MAKVDIAGLLTGIGSAPIDPMSVGGTYEQRALAAGQRASDRMLRGFGALTGADVRTTEQKAQQALAQLDPTSPADRAKIIEIVSRVNPERVSSLKQAFAARDEQMRQQAVSEKQAQERLDIMRMQAEAAGDTRDRLMAGDRKAIRDAATAADKASGQVDMSLGLARRYEALEPTGGAGGKALEAFKSFMGGQDEVSSLKTEFKNLVNTGIIQALPPGVASDKDIEMARSGFPNEAWSSEEIIRFLRGRAKLQAFESERRRFEANWISKNKGDASGWNDAWHAKRKEEGFSEFVVEKYGLPELDLPPEDEGFDRRVLDEIRARKTAAAKNQADARILGATGGFGL